MKHGSFTHAVTGASVDVVETLGGPDTGRIECTCASFGLGAGLVYRLEERPAGWTLVVKEMKTEPSMEGLGSLLMWHAAQTALLGGAALMDAAAVARDARTAAASPAFSPMRRRQARGSASSPGAAWTICRATGRRSRTRPSRQLGTRRRCGCWTVPTRGSAASGPAGEATGLPSLFHPFSATLTSEQTIMPVLSDATLARLASYPPTRDGYEVPDVASGPACWNWVLGGGHMIASEATSAPSIVQDLVVTYDRAGRQIFPAWVRPHTGDELADVRAWYKDLYVPSTDDEARIKSLGFTSEELAGLRDGLDPSPAKRPRVDLSGKEEETAEDREAVALAFRRDYGPAEPDVEAMGKALERARSTGGKPGRFTIPQSRFLTHLVRVILQENGLVPLADGGAPRYTVEVRSSNWWNTDHWALGVLLPGAGRVYIQTTPARVLRHGCNDVWDEGLPQVTVGIRELLQVHVDTLDRVPLRP